MTEGCDILHIGATLNNRFVCFSRNIWLLKLQELFPTVIALAQLTYNIR
jgi:hypothetical protein